MITEHIQVVDTTNKCATKGSAGLNTQLAGQATTVSNVATSTGGIGRGKLIDRDVK